jgi:hypothetical protein
MSNKRMAASFGLVVAMAFGGLWQAMEAKAQIKELRERVEKLEARRP